MSDIRKNLDFIDAQIANLQPEAVCIAVSKSQPGALIDDALSLGVRDFGENRLQEAQTRWLERKSQYPDLCLHFIGQLQSRKTDDVVALFDVIHTVDRPKLVDALAASMQKTGRNLPCFIQVNTGQEPQKGGVLPHDLEALYEHTQKAGLKVQGLMCIPPAQANPLFHFALLKRWGQRLGLPMLSMGMSNDYEAALRMGANYIRVGTALFQSREN